MEFAASLKDPIRKVKQAGRHCQAGKYDVDVHDIEPLRQLQLALQSGFMPQKRCCIRINDKVFDERVNDKGAANGG